MPCLIFSVVTSHPSSSPPLMNSSGSLCSGAVASERARSSTSENRAEFEFRGPAHPGQGGGSQPRQSTNDYSSTPSLRTYSNSITLHARRICANADDCPSFLVWTAASSRLPALPSTPSRRPNVQPQPTPTAPLTPPLPPSPYTLPHHGFCRGEDAVRSRRSPVRFAIAPSALSPSSIFANPPSTSSARYIASEAVVLAGDWRVFILESSSAGSDGTID